MPSNIELKIRAYSTLHFNFRQGASVKSYKLQLTVFYFFFYICFYISSYYFLQLFRTSFNITWKRFLLQIFLFKRIHSDPLNGQNLLSMTKRFSQFSLKCLLKYFFKNLLTKSCKSISFTLVVNCYCTYILKVPTTDSLVFSFNCYLAVPRPTLGYSQGDSLTNSMLITTF